MILAISQHSYKQQLNLEPSWQTNHCELVTLPHLKNDFFVDLFRTGREDSCELAIWAFTIGLTVVVNPILAHKSNLFLYSSRIYISLSQHASSGNCGQRLTGQKLVLLWAKSKFYSLIEFLTLKEIYCTCSVIVRIPSKAFSTSSASPSSTFYSPCPHLNYPRLQRPCHPWSPSVFSTSSLFSFPLASWSFVPPCSINHMSPSRLSYSYSLAMIHHSSHQTRNCWILELLCYHSLLKPLVYHHPQVLLPPPTQPQPVHIFLLDI